MLHTLNHVFRLECFPRPAAVKFQAQLRGLRFQNFQLRELGRKDYLVSFGKWHATVNS